MKLKIKNQLNIKGEKLIGQSEFEFNKDKRIAEYRIENKLFKFYMFDKLEKPNKKFRGNFNLKPFYASLNGELDEINLNFLFGYNDFIVQLLKTEILNHKNT